MKNIFIYLFVFSFLINIFQYVNSSKILDFKEREVSKIKSQLQQSRDSLTEARFNDYFDIANDEDAQEYYYSQNLDYQKVMVKVNEDLVSLNANKEGNSLIPYEPIDGKQFLINKAKVLNHRWIVAEFSNGDYWGQVLIKYFYNDGEATQFQTIDTILYEKQKTE